MSSRTIQMLDASLPADGATVTVSDDGQEFGVLLDVDTEAASGEHLLILGPVEAAQLAAELSRVLAEAMTAAENERIDRARTRHGIALVGGAS